jgi:hypothetical protein
MIFFLKLLVSWFPYEKTLPTSAEIIFAEKQKLRVPRDHRAARSQRHGMTAGFAKFSPMDYSPGMSASRLSVLFGIIFMFAAAPVLRADRLDLQNGDRYFGRVISISGDSVVLESDVLGKITVPRKNVTGLLFGTNTAAMMPGTNAAQSSVLTNLSAVPLSSLAGTNADMAALLRNLDVKTNSILQIREKMLAGSPEATGKFDDMVNGLLSGQLSVDDIRREAKSSADQLRELKREIGPDAGDSVDAYLSVLDHFLAETDTADTEPTNAAPAAPASQSIMQASHPAPGH